MLSRSRKPKIRIRNDARGVSQGWVYRISLILSMQSFLLVCHPQSGTSLNANVSTFFKQQDLFFSFRLASKFLFFPTFINSKCAAKTCRRRLQFSLCSRRLFNLLGTGSPLAPAVQQRCFLVYKRNLDRQSKFVPSSELHIPKDFSSEIGPRISVSGEQQVLPQLNLVSAYLFCLQAFLFSLA